MLLGGRSKFSEFVADEGIATNTLTERLGRLQDAGLLVRQRDPDDGRRWIYAPTMAAVDLLPALLELMLWGTLHTSGSAPGPMLQAAAEDKEALLAELRAAAAARVPTN